MWKHKIMEMLGVGNDWVHLSPVSLLMIAWTERQIQKHCVYLQWLCWHYVWNNNQMNAPFQGTFFILWLNCQTRTGLPLMLIWWYVLLQPEISHFSHTVWKLGTESITSGRWYRDMFISVFALGFRTIIRIWSDLGTGSAYIIPMTTLARLGNYCQ